MKSVDLIGHDKFLSWRQLDGCSVTRPFLSPAKGVACETMKALPVCCKLLTSPFPSSITLPPSLPLHHPPLQASDNHIGYMEKDPVRCNDSLESFEEVLRIAKEQEVTQHPGHGFMISTSMLANSSIERRSQRKQATGATKY